jgi:hypothetical protein
VLKWASGSIDWRRFLLLVQRQRVEGLVNEALADAGADVPEAIGADIARIGAAVGAQNLFFAAESARLQRLLDDDGIRFLFVKGVTLAMLAYGTLATKKAFDIDLLVDPSQVLAASRTLVNAGYQLSIPGHDLSPQQFETWVTICKESLWIHQKTGMVVELHSSLVDNPRLMPNFSLKAQRAMVSVGSGIVLPTLQKDELFTYLCVHGAWHAWSRIKWLVDIAALLSQESEVEIQRLYRRSVELGGGRSSAQALLLGSRLLGLRLPAPLKRELERDRGTRWLVAIAMDAMAGRGERELDDTVFGTVLMNFSHFLIARGWRYKLFELGRKFRTPEDQIELPLPAPLHFLYPIIAVPRWVLRRARLSRS